VPEHPRPGTQPMIADFEPKSDVPGRAPRGRPNDGPRAARGNLGRSCFRKGGRHVRLLMTTIDRGGTMSVPYDPTERFSTSPNSALGSPSACVTSAGWCQSVASRSTKSAALFASSHPRSRLGSTATDTDREVRSPVGKAPEPLRPLPSVTALYESSAALGNVACPTALRAVTPLHR
jgi:hypothetical protein